MAPMTLPIPRAVREFVDGIRAIPGQLELIREAVAQHDPRGWRASAYGKQQSIDALEAVVRMRERSLEDERAAHEETKRTVELLQSAEIYGPKNLAMLQEQLASETAARKEAERKLDALTRWRLQSDEPCPMRDPCQIFSARDGSGRYVEKMILRAACNMNQTDHWRHTPESLAAMEKTDGK
jgi:hypothetical protein